MKFSSNNKKNFSSVRLKLRIGHDNERRYAEPVYTEKGKLKPFWCRVEGREERHPEGVYYLRIKGRQWRKVGQDASLAESKKLQITLKVQAGLALEPERQQSPSTGSGLLLKQAVKDYLDNIKKLKSHKTWCAYRRHTELFVQRCKATSVESITKQHILDHLDFLTNDLGLSPRTVHNHCASIGIMLRTLKLNISSMLNRNDKPTYEEPLVNSYYEDDLQNLFTACSAQGENSLLWETFVATGFREQEMQFLAGSDIDFKGSLIFAQGKQTALGSSSSNRSRFKVKDREARAVPVPTGLIQKLGQHQKRNPSKWVFPSREGKPDGHFLRRLRIIAFNGGLNCGNCTNSRGFSCKTRPICRYWSLHKFRRTFATIHHEHGVSARTLQTWLGHENLETTLRYLAIADRHSVRMLKQVNNTFDWLYRSQSATAEVSPDCIKEVAAESTKSGSALAPDTYGQVNSSDGIRLRNRPFA